MRNVTQRVMQRALEHGDRIQQLFWFGTAIALVTGAFSGCSTEGFRCGEPLRTDKNIVQTCSGPYEICLCATRSCAAPADIRLGTALGGAGGVGGVGGANDKPASPTCDGYFYLDEPFADPDWAGKCVPKAHFGYDIIAQDDPPGTLCPTRDTAPQMDDEENEFEDPKPEDPVPADPGPPMMSEDPPMGGQGGSAMSMGGGT